MAEDWKIMSRTVIVIAVVSTGSAAAVAIAGRVPVIAKRVLVIASEAKQSLPYC